jgi:hypothetical protein
MNERVDYPIGVTEPREIVPGVFMENKKHWGMNSYAGEGITEVNGDSSGCVRKSGGLELCPKPHIAIYRHYWSDKGRISCFLSYPEGMGYAKGYFWEIYTIGNKEIFDDIERFGTEKECEEAIIAYLKP